MLTIYAQFLLTDLPPSSVPADTALAASSSESSSAEPPRPYSHIREQPLPLPTVPQFETVVIDNITNHALLTQRLRARMPESMPDAVWAVADSGASHILIREGDAHILTDLKYTPVLSPPLAVLKTANGAPLRQGHVGRGLSFYDSIRVQGPRSGQQLARVGTVCRPCLHIDFQALSVPDLPT